MQQAARDGASSPCSPLGTQITGTHTTRASSDMQPRGGAGPALPHTAASKGQDQFWAALSLRFSVIGVTDINTDCRCGRARPGHHHGPGDLQQPAPHHHCLFRSGSLHKKRTILPLFISYTAPYICSPQWYLTIWLYKVSNRPVVSSALPGKQPQAGTWVSFTCMDLKVLGKSMTSFTFSFIYF